MTIYAANNLEFITCDIGNTHINTNTDGNIYTHAGAEFKMACIIAGGDFWNCLRRYMDYLIVGTGGMRTYHLP